MNMLRKIKFLRRSRLLCAKLARDTRGITAVEFAILAPLFFSLLLSSIELGFVMSKKAMLESAAAEVSRSIYTGAASEGLVTQEELQDWVCERIDLIYNHCEDNLSIELTVIDSFTDIPDSDAVCVDSDEDINPTVSFNPGTTNEIMYMRICLTTSIFTPGMGVGLALPKTENGKVQLVSALAFSNEPF